MRQVNWILGERLVDRDQTLAKLLRGFIGGDRQGNYLCLVSNKRRADFLTARLKEHYLREDISLFKPKVFPLQEFAEHLYQQEIASLRHTKIINDLERRICMEEAINRQSEALVYFDKILTQKKIKNRFHYPGILRGLARFIGFLKDHDLDRDFIERLVLDEFGNAGAKDHDLTLLFDAYEEVLRQNSLLDREGRLLAVTKWLEGKKTVRSLQGLEVLAIDSFTFLKRSEENFLLALIAYFPRVAITLDIHLPLPQFLDDLSKGKNEIQFLNHRVYLPLKKFLTHLSSQTDQRILSGNDSEKRPLDHLALFKKGKRSERNQFLDQIVKVKVMPNRIEEVRFICRGIKDLIRKGVQLADIHVVFPRIEPYLSILYEIFPQYGIPFSVTRGLLLNSSPLAIVVRAILQIPQGYQREDLFQFFSSSLVSYPEEIDLDSFEEFLRRLGIGKSTSLMSHEDLIGRFEAFRAECEKKGKKTVHFDVATLDRYARSANVRGGQNLLNDWMVPLDAYFLTLTRKEGASEEEKERILRRYFLIVRQIYLLDRLKKIFDGFEKCKNPEETLAHLKLLISLFHIPENLCARLRGIAELKGRERMFLFRRDIRALEMVFRIIGEMQEAFRLKRKISQEPWSEENPLLETARLLNEELSGNSISDSVELEVVQITETLEVRGIDFDSCFFGGLTSKDFPRLDSPDFILPETPNARFRILDTVEESRYLLGYILRNARSQVSLTYPKVDGGEELEISPFLEDLMSGRGSYENDPAKSQSTLYAHAELEQKIGSLLIPGELPQENEFYFLLAKSRDPEALTQSLNAELSRKGNQQFGLWDGILQQSPFDTKKQAELIFSASQLGEFASCPQHYYYARLLALEPLDELTEEMEADEFGSYLHEILETFSRQWRKNGENKITEANFSKAVELMRVSAEALLSDNQMHVEYVLWDEKKRRIFSGLEAGFESGYKGILRGFLEHERERSKTGFVPGKFEEKFGEGLDFEIAGVKIRGKVDRLDTLERNVAKGWPEAVLVLDYKTGSVGTLSSIASGLNFQLPVYLMAVQEKYPRAVVGGAYYSLKNPAEVSVKNYFMMEDLFAEGILSSKKRTRHAYSVFNEVYAQLIGDRIRAIDEQIRQGNFHYAFEEVRCRYCDFKNICRRDPERLRKLEENEDKRAYIPKKNLMVYSLLKKYQDLKNEIAQKVEKKKNAKKRKSTDSEIRTFNEFIDAFERLPSIWRERLQSEQNHMHEAWQESIS